MARAASGSAWKPVLQAERVPDSADEAQAPDFMEFLSVGDVRSLTLGDHPGCIGDNGGQASYYAGS
jgi:hypothetical protein